MAHVNVEGEKKLHVKKQKVSRTLKRDELPVALIKSIRAKFTSPVIDLKKDYQRTNDNIIYKAQKSFNGKCVEYEVVTEKRFSDIVAIVEVVESVTNL